MPDLVWSLPPLAERMHSAACLISIAGFYSTFAERLIRLRFCVLMCEAASDHWTLLKHG